MMKHDRLLAFIFGLGVMMSQAMAQSNGVACASVGNMPNDQWGNTTNNSGTFTLTQQNNGAVIGGFVEANVPNCPSGTKFSVQGVMDPSGTYILSMTLDTPVTGCQNFVATGTVGGGLSCNTTTMSWTNEDGTSGNATFEHSCYVPTGETVPVFTGWGDSPNTQLTSTTGKAGQATVATFQQYLTANITYNFGGRVLSESSPTQGQDTCWYQGNPANVPASTTVTGGGITLNGSAFTSSGSPYNDDIGPSTVLAAYWRALHRVPCGSTVSQAMALQCAGGSTTYITNTDATGIDISQVLAGRALQLSGQKTVSRIWAPSAGVNAIINQLLQGGK
jgi:hypothetical protein